MTINILLLEDDVALNRTINKVLELDRHTVAAYGEDVSTKDDNY